MRDRRLLACVDAVGTCGGERGDGMGVCGVRESSALGAGRRADARNTVQALARQLAAATTPDPLASPVRLWGMFLAAPAMLPPRR